MPPSLAIYCFRTCSGFAIYWLAASMHHDRAHAVVARLLTDPGSSSVDRSLPTLDEFTAVELAKLRLFQGFITKIKHNPLLPILPLTFKALRKFGVEIEFFAQHSPKF